MDKTVQVFSSFKDADDADARFDSALTPEQHLKIVIEFPTAATLMPLNKDLCEFVVLLTSRRAQAKAKKSDPR